MTDVSKLKRRTLGAPPSAAEASRNLETPEVPPATLVSLGGYERLDGRSLRRSNRVIQFATRVTPEFDQRIRELRQLVDVFGPVPSGNVQGFGRRNASLDVELQLAMQSKAGGVIRARHQLIPC